MADSEGRKSKEALDVLSVMNAELTAGSVALVRKMDQAKRRLALACTSAEA